MKEKSRQQVKFYDPHPGLKGAMMRIPEPMRKIAKSLDNKVMTLNEAVKKISPIAEKFGGEIKVIYQWEFILFELKEKDDTIHGYRLIRYEKI